MSLVTDVSLVSYVNLVSDNFLVSVKSPELSLATELVNIIQCTIILRDLCP